MVLATHDLISLAELESGLGTIHRLVSHNLVGRIH